MNENVMIVWVVFIVAVATIVLGAIAARARWPKAGSSPDLRAENERLGGEVTTLKERVAVLERIATDKNHRLEHEFEQLRGN